MKRIGFKLYIAVALVLSLMCFPISTFAETASMKNESGRVVKIYDMEGIVTVTGEDGSFPSVFTGAELKSGDKIEVGKDSQVYLKIDNDKYVMADEKTTFVIDVSGTEKDSKTKIKLISGSIINRVDEKLNRNSSYEIITPNSTTAIRGTLVRTKLMENPDQTQTTQTDVFEGTVEMHTVQAQATTEQNEEQNATENPAQNATENLSQNATENLPQNATQKLVQDSLEEVNQADNQILQFTQGQMSKITTDSKGRVGMTTGTINFHSLSPEQIQFLIDSTKTGRKLPITNEELTEIQQEAIEEREEEESTMVVYTLHSSSNGATTAGDLPTTYTEDQPSETDVQTTIDDVSDNDKGSTSNQPIKQ